MSASGATTNYNLSQFISTDIPSWLGDYNGDMLKIDTGINGAKLAADSAALAASAAQNDASTALSNVGTLSTTVGTLSNTVGTAVGNINTINSLIGNGTPTTTDQTIIGAINELHADQGDLTNLTTTDKTSLVAAINEVAGGGGNSGVIATITADGVKTLGALLDEVYAAIKDTVTLDNGGSFSLLVPVGGDNNNIGVYNCRQVDKTNGVIAFSNVTVTSSVQIEDVFQLKASSSVSYRWSQGAVTDNTSSVLTSGAKIKVTRN